MKTDSSIRTAAGIRSAFIDFFVERHAHVFRPSSPVVPLDDPTLMFINAGMNQFKPIFLGQVEKGSGFDGLKRAANSQKCIRAGGKHNDLEDVGRDHYHHTFFEMLGNWSFGDYFKAEAIGWAWRLLTGPPMEGCFGLDPDRLHVTVFAGDKNDGTPADEEAEQLWSRLVPSERISRWGRKDNFWEMGATGPCGPCSEIHYDFTPDLSGGALVNAGDERVVELWNLVFIQFNRGADGALSPLPARHVDTGMGLERLVRVLQHKTSNYEIDLFTPIFESIRERTGARQYCNGLDDPVDIAYRVIADHVRCLVAAITDGAVPSNTGRGYVLRRILRRAVRHARQVLRVDRPMLYQLVPAVVESLGSAFPEMIDRADRVAAIIRDEELSFLRTLDRGMRLFAEAAGEATNGSISAENAFKLHDTHGFPIDLTRVMAVELGLEVDEEGYQQLRDRSRQSAQAVGSGDTRTMDLTADAIGELARRGISATDDTSRYPLEPIEAKVQAIYDGSSFLDTATEGMRVGVILDRTNHYAEAGGQVGDRGTIDGADGVVRVEQTLGFGDYVLHIGTVDGSIVGGASVTVAVDLDHRRPTQSNHTSTHLLNYALREVVGEEEDQRGSHVGPERLRFDFACSHALDREQLERTEQIVNSRIEEDGQVSTGVVPLATAMSINGLRAVFGERYPDPVRVVAIGVALKDVLERPDDPRWSQHSIELCGGTHLASTGEAKRLVIAQESALAAGVRRIIALTGDSATAAQAEAAAIEQTLDGTERLDDDSLIAAFDGVQRSFDEATLGAVARHRIDARLETLRVRVKKLRKLSRAAATADVVNLAREIANEAGGPIIVAAVAAADRGALLSALDTVRSKHPAAAVMLLGHDTDSVAIVARVSDDHIARGLKAGDWVRVAAEICGGKGGGRPDMAQAGGKQPERVPDAVTAARTFAEQTLS